MFSQYLDILVEMRANLRKFYFSMESDSISDHNRVKGGSYKRNNRLILPFITYCVWISV